MEPGELTEQIRAGVQAAKSAQRSVEDLATETARREADLDRAVEHLRELGLDEDSIEAALGEDAAAPRGRHAGQPHDQRWTADDAAQREQLGAQS